MKDKQTNHVSRLMVVVCGVAALFSCGCAKKIDNAHVNAEKARNTLRAALDSWKNGDAVDALQSARPPIYVIDEGWKSGTTLKDYELAGDGEEKDAHLFCPVKLTVVDARGKEWRGEVVYIVSTAPNLTVSRKVF
jgi:hypothetical protein